MRKIIVANPAQIDLREHFAYLADKNFDTALQFFDAARQTFADLARMPELGSRYSSQKKRLQDLRKWHIKGFKRFLIFYRFNEETIEIVRVLYGTQDIQGLLERES
jgi:toxin ParE1/3/4